MLVNKVIILGSYAPEEPQLPVVSSVSSGILGIGAS